MKGKYFIASMKTGFMIEGFENFNDAVKALNKHKGSEVVQIVDEDHHPLHRYIVTFKRNDGKYFCDAVIARSGYTGSDYASEHGLETLNDIMVSIGDV